MDIDSFEVAVDSFKTLYQNRKVLLGAILGLIFVVIIVLVLPSSQAFRTQAGVNPAAIGSLLILLAGVVIAAIIVQSLITSFVISAAYYPSKRLGELAVMALGRWPYLIVSGIIYGILTIAGLIVFIIPGVYIALRLFPYYASVVAGKHGPIEGLKNAWNMTRGQAWALLGISIIIVVAVLVVELAFSIASPILGSAAGGFIGYAQPIAGVLIYSQLSSQSSQQSRKGKSAVGIRRTRTRKD